MRIHTDSYVTRPSNRLSLLGAPAAGIRWVGAVAMLRPLSLFVAASLLFACGGRVSDPGEETDPPTESPKPKDDGTTKDKPADWVTEPLGECPEPISPDAGCDYYVSALSACFATKTEACACACPRDRDSTCVSGFQIGDWPVEVDCF
jgi:hypothetical protein